MTLYLRTAFRSWDFVMGLLVGVAAGALAINSEVREQGVTVALAGGAFGVTIMSVVLGALSVITAFFDGPYRRVLQDAGGIREALAPYLVVAAIAGAAAIAAFITAVGWAVFDPLQQEIGLGLTALLTGWCVAGMVSLVELTIFHAEQRVKLMQGIDEAADIRASRVSETTRN